MANIAGRILIMPKGTYDASATYELLDLVLYNNASWLAKKTATGIEPAEGEYWHKMADGMAVANDLETETEGYALDARQGKVLKELIDAVGADALRERLDAVEAENATQGEEITTVKADIETLRLAIEALGNVDNATVRYVSDEADENFDWIQVQDAEGNWINAYRAYAQRYELYVDQNNGGEFEAYAGGIETIAWKRVTPTITFADDMTIKVSGSASSSHFYGCGSAITKPIDLSRFKTITFNYDYSISSNFFESCYGTLFISQTKESVMNAIASERLFSGSSSLSGDGTVSFDVSSLSGEYYIGIQVNCATSDTTGAVTTTTISNMYME